MASQQKLGLKMVEFWEGNHVNSNWKMFGLIVSTAGLTPARGAVTNPAHSQGCRFVPYTFSETSKATDGTKLDLNIGETRVWP